MAPPRMPWATVVALVALFASGANAGHRGSGGTPGEFDYFLLSLSWSPAYCLDSPGAGECVGPRRYGFIVHGLWPQYEHGWPQYCDVHVPVPEEVVMGIADLMPARELVYHEWSAHGTCSGLDPAHYFALVRRAAAGIAMPPSLLTPSTALEQTPAAVGEAFQRANPRLPAKGVLVTCTMQGTPRLREVRICLDRDLAPRPCSADDMKSACRAPQLIVPPLR
jgi:ribonuclease T2